MQVNGIEAREEFLEEMGGVEAPELPFYDMPKATEKPAEKVKRERVGKPAVIAGVKNNYYITVESYKAQNQKKENWFDRIERKISAGLNLENKKTLQQLVAASLILPICSHTYAVADILKIYREMGFISSYVIGFLFSFIFEGAAYILGLSGKSKAGSFSLFLSYLISMFALRSMYNDQDSILSGAFFFLIASGLSGMPPVLVAKLTDKIRAINEARKAAEMLKKQQAAQNPDEKKEQKRTKLSTQQKVDIINFYLESIGVKSVKQMTEYIEEVYNIQKSTSHALLAEAREVIRKKETEKSA